ncbi:MAG: TMEM43 family protein [Vulcanimicrobiota bacterium]
MEWSLVSGPNGKLCSKDFFPERVQIGALSVSPEDHYLKNNPAQVVLRPEQVKVPPGACWVGNVLYLDGRPKDPMENDLRVVFRIFPPMTLSAIGIQKGARLEPRPGTAQLWMHKGSVSIADYVRSHQRPLPPPSFGRQETMRWALLGTMLLVISGLLKQFKIRKDWEYPSLSGAGRTQSD